MAKNIYTKLGVLGSFLLMVVLGSILTTAHFATAYVRYGPAAQLNAGDIKTLHILNNTILGEDISTGASTTMNKFLTGELYATGSVSLPAGSLTSAMILNSTILSADMADYNSLLLASSTIGSLTATSSVSLPANSITDAMTVDTLTASNYLSLSSWFATTSATHLVTLSGLTTASSSNVRASNDLRADGTLTLKGVAYTPPSADGSNGQIFATNGAGVLSWTAPGVAKYLVDTTAKTLTGTLATTSVYTVTLAPGDFGAGNVLHIGGTMYMQVFAGSSNTGSAIRLGNGTATTTLSSIGGGLGAKQFSRHDAWLTASSSLLAQLYTGKVDDSGNNQSRYAGGETTYNANNPLYLSFDLRIGDTIDVVAWQGITIEKY